MEILKQRGRARKPAQVSEDAGVVQDSNRVNAGAGETGSAGDRTQAILARKARDAAAMRVALTGMPYLLRK